LSCIGSYLQVAAVSQALVNKLLERDNRERRVLLNKQAAGSGY